MLALCAPPSPEEQYLRPSLVPGLCKAVASNLRFLDEFAIYESAEVFFDRDFSSPYDSSESLPLQRRCTAGALVGDPGNVNTLYRKAKGIMEALPRYAHIEPFTFERLKKPAWADDVVWLNIYHKGEQAGNMALLSKRAALDCDIKNSAVMIFELDVDALEPYPSRTNEFIALPDYPMIEYDISLLFDLKVKWSEIYDAIVKKMGSGSLLHDVSFVDEYKGNQIPDGKKSVTFRLLIGSLEKTLTSNEIEKCANAVTKKLVKSFGAKQRN